MSMSRLGRLCGWRQRLTGEFDPKAVGPWRMLLAELAAATCTGRLRRGHDFLWVAARRRLAGGISSPGCWRPCGRAGRDVEFTVEANPTSLS